MSTESHDPGGRLPTDAERKEVEALEKHHIAQEIAKEDVKEGRRRFAPLRQWRKPKG